MRTPFLPLLFALAPFIALGQASFTSTQDGDWNDGATWGNTSPGTAGTDFPSRTDTAIIEHVVTIDATDDNGFTGTTADALGLANVGTFNGSETANFYQTGNITINSAGTLTSSVRLMFGGTTIINGTLTTGGGDDIINLGNLDINAGSTFSCGDDFVLSGNSETNIDVTAISADDLYLDHTDALLCGSGALSISDEIQLFNSAVTSTQICSGFTVTCTDGNCGLGTGGTVTGSGSFTLPVELIAFTAHWQANEGVLLHWTTASEINNDFFSIERSTNGTAWEVILTVAGAGTSTQMQQYSAIDSDPLNGLVYYRLKQTDFDGQYTYSDWRQVRTEQEGSAVFTAFPNPAQDRIYLTGNASVSGNLRVFDGTGREFTQAVQIKMDQQTIDVSGLAPGWYIIRSETTAYRLLKL